MKALKKQNDVLITSRNSWRMTGFSLLELLIALAIFSYVFLGIAKLQLLLANKTQSNYQQLQAAQIADDLLNRIDRNENAVNEYIALSATKISSPRNCTSSPCDRTDIARNDLFLAQQKLESLPFSSLAIAKTSNSTSVSIYWHANPVVGANKACPQQSENDYHCMLLQRYMETTP
ncbi:type IV pilus modification PilV family protein [Thalassotalea litorea]|uniref:type IV pilus modification PilV family protein n=1 Tax=Thalassotalea litorea TaxID=2020715 RepID=UPI0037370268